MAETKYDINKIDEIYHRYESTYEKLIANMVRVLSALPHSTYKQLHDGFKSSNPYERSDALTQINNYIMHDSECNPLIEQHLQAELDVLSTHPDSDYALPYWDEMIWLVFRRIAKGEKI